MIEAWLEALGAVVDASIYDPASDYGGEAGVAYLGNLRFRYYWDRVQIAWIPTFDRWANSVDWWCDPPGSPEDLKKVIAEAERRGAVADRSHYNSCSEKKIELT